MTIRSDFRDAAAELSQEILDNMLGEDVTFSNDGEAGSTITCYWPEASQAFESVLGAGSDVETAELIIPRQTGFPPTAGIKTGAEITRGGATWTVIEARPDDLGASWTVTVQRKQVNTLGV